MIKGDALGEIDAPADGRWTPEIRERYADRIIDRIARQVPNLKASIVSRSVLSPADLEAMNINLVGGDPYSGECSIDQFMVWRPLPGARNHATPVKHLHHIGASTHPGPGLGGTSGYHVANALARKRVKSN
ncbi:phytoene desaturase family protein [Cupriavidus pinatubonensis]|uniref:phytoene desaturase family protein n=1 Tax=Cupriavidus pinatubonensis TaxID=248026 RepID=UPI003610D0BB